LLLKVSINEALLHYPLFQNQQLALDKLLLQTVNEIPVVDMYINQGNFYIVSKIHEVISWWLQGQKEVIVLTIDKETLMSIYYTTPKFLIRSSYSILDLLKK
jgi:hypothetical protein